MILEESIREFWNSHPCGEHLVGGVKADWEEFFEVYDALRYGECSYTLECLDAIDFRGKRVLEIGPGLGADGERIIRRGGVWSGIDLTPESADRVITRLRLRGLPYERMEVGSACRLPFARDSFDIVYSHGVLHHVPEIGKAQSEIARVLKPGGRLIAMLYAKYSLNYLVSIMFVRRLVLLLLGLTGARPAGIVGQHLRNAREQGFSRYLRMKSFIHRNTDGPLNPYTKVYNLAHVRKDFPDFRVVKAHKGFMHAPPLSVSWLRLGSLLGWNLWVHMEPRKRGNVPASALAGKPGAHEAHAPSAAAAA